MSVCMIMEFTAASGVTWVVTVARKEKNSNKKRGGPNKRFQFISGLNEMDT